MRRLHILTRMAAVGSALLWPFGAIAGQGIVLLECIGSVCEIPADSGPLGVLGFYFNLLYPWMVGLAAAVAVLMGLWGGIEIMWAGSNDGNRQKGTNRLMMSIGGLVLLLFSATILNLLNPTFFR